MLFVRRVAAVAALAFAISAAFAAPARAAEAGKDAETGVKEKLPESDPFGRLTVTQVERRLGKPNVYVFDGNRPDTYAENHLQGAVNLNHKEITPARLPRDKAATLIFYCMNEL